ncbi:hypothetical protein DFH08DRAFT_975753 [Mycena albidolilacea]|uniref:Uncharacterized protein n=1 Tax=Mycena albidolilacea TaxID=1033008 RepID=A0AAD6Z5A9_9AGAR|nr:hypothetical protein DFH08DRAFT_975753 [Mycena albidolilacea]
MTNSSPKLKQSQKTKKASEQRRKHCQALQQYAERNAETLREKAKERMRRLRTAHAAQNKSSDRSLADFDYRERKRRQKYIENYGGRSYHQFYYPLLEFFGEGNLAGVTIIDETKHCRSKKFKLEITEEYEDAKQRFQLGKKPKCFFYLVREPLAGEKAAIYSLKSAAENALPRTGSFEIVRCKTIAQAVYEWCRWCQDAHLTCDLTYLTNIHRTLQHCSAPPPTPADSAVYVPGSESEEEEVPRATHPTHPTRRWVREVTPDSGGYCVLPDAERPIILPIDNKAAKKLGIGMDGIKAEVGSGTMRIKREGGTARVKHEGIGADGVKVEAGSGTVRIKRKGGTMRVKCAGGAVGVNRKVEGGMDHEGDGTRLEAGATPSKHRRGVSTPVPLFDEDSPPPRSSLRVPSHHTAWSVSSRQPLNTPMPLFEEDSPPTSPRPGASHSIPAASPPSPPSHMTPARVVSAAHAAAASHAPSIAAAAVSHAPSIADAVSRTLATNTDVSRAPSIAAAVSSRTPAVNAAISRSSTTLWGSTSVSNDIFVGDFAGCSSHLPLDKFCLVGFCVDERFWGQRMGGLESRRKVGGRIECVRVWSCILQPFQQCVDCSLIPIHCCHWPLLLQFHQQKFFRSMDMAMASMDQNDVVVIVSSAVEMAAAIEKGKKVDRGEDVNMEE